MKRIEWFKKPLALLLCLCLLAVYIPSVPTVKTAAAASRWADPSTMDSWMDFYGPQVTTTQYAGGVWMDKSVFTDASAFAESGVSLLDPEHHFLVALSAIASNKEVIGYSTVPTDTVLLLDGSAAMRADAQTITQEVNRTLAALFSSNYNNRVSVIVYGDESAVLLPLGRYTSETACFLKMSGDTVTVDASVRDAQGQPLSETASYTMGGGAFAQDGLLRALAQFESADTSVEADNIQDGAARLPILFWMSGSAPTRAVNAFDRVERDGEEAHAGDGTDASASAELSFLTQLTASYVMNRVEAHYGREGEGLFYTIGHNLGADTPSLCARAVLDPSNSTLTDAFWTAFAALEGATGLELHTPSGAGRDHRILTIYKNAHATAADYVDEYISSAADLQAAFETAVEEIHLHSRHYPTHLEGGNPDFGGYIEFNDAIGRYMEVKDIKGVVLGDRLFTGAALTSKLNEKTDNGLGTIADPSALGLTLRDSIKTRLGIADNTTAIDLIGKAYRAGQLYYDEQTGAYSNYIAWYADAAGAYVGFWDESDTAVAPKNAAYAVRSYGFLGETEGAIKDSDMMYMTVQVRTSLVSGQQEVLWKIPASLVPTVTYKVRLDGNSEATAKNVSLTREGAQPIRLLFEVGLEKAVNRYNVAQITDEAHVTPDGARVFWTNAWDDSKTNIEDHVTSYARFTPSPTNDRYYYTSDTPLYQKQGETYVLLTDPSHTVDVNGTYYRARYIFSETSTTSLRLFEAVSSVSLQKATYGENGWFIPKGTVYRRQQDRYFEKRENASASVPYAYNLYVAMTNASYDAYSMLGNNGRLLVEPATGLRLRRTSEVAVPGTTGSATYRLHLKSVFEQPLNGTYTVERIPDGESRGERGQLTVSGGVAQVTLQSNECLYITDLPVGATYTVEALSCEAAYRPEKVLVNGAEQDSAAAGRLTRQTIDDVCFAYVPSSTGGVYITTEVEHPFGEDTVVPTSVKTEWQLALSSLPQSKADVTATLHTADGQTTLTADDNGVMRLTVGVSDTVWIDGLPAGASYEVTAVDKPLDGFEVDHAACEGVQGTVSTVGNTKVRLAQTYAPASVTLQEGDCVIEATATVEGRERREEDVFTFVLEELYPETGEALETLSTVVLDTLSETTARFDLQGEVFDHVGTYHFMFREKVSESKDGLTYDTENRRFHVDVTDKDWDGRLEIDHVSDVMNTSVTQNAEGAYTVASDFCHRYAPVVGTVLTVPIKKTVVGDRFSANGFRFALWDETQTYVIHRSSVTDQNGDATLRIAYSAAGIGQHRYRLAECASGIDGMADSAVTYDVIVTVFDKGDGAVGATYAIYDESGALVEGTPVFENAYTARRAQLVISGRKQLEGRVHAAGEFAFALYRTDASFDLDNATLLQTLANDHNGGFVFDPIVFDTVGTYRFAVRECGGQLGGIVYDDTVYTVTATVTEENGVWRVVTDSEEPIVFRNRYEAVPADVTVEGVAVLTGRDTADNDFAFLLKAEDGTVLQRTFNRGARFAFETLTFDTVGEYRYRLCEEQGNRGGITYDAAQYTVVVTVTDNGFGRLRAQTSYVKHGQETVGVSFRNAYTATPYELCVTLEKTLSGRAMEEGEFLFVLSGSKSGRGLLSASNAADGTVTFEPFLVYDPGVYVLHVSEVQGDGAYVTYDRRTFDVIVTIEDDHNGRLIETARSYAVDGQPTARVCFENTYNGPDATTSTTVTTTVSTAPTNSQTVSTTAPRSPQTGEADQAAVWYLLVAGALLVSASFLKRRYGVDK